MIIIFQFLHAIKRDSKDERHLETECNDNGISCSERRMNSILDGYIELN